jgi:hypothetical protein
MSALSRRTMLRSAAALPAVAGTSPLAPILWPDDNHPDAALLAAERRLAELERSRREAYRAYREAGQPITCENEPELINDVFDDETDTLADFIDETEPQTLVGAAVKLRRLADPDQLLLNDGYDRNQPETSARQVLALVERLIEGARVT